MIKTETIVDAEYKIPKIAIHETETPGFEARVATALVERWGMVAAEIDGEDSAGRAKVRRMTPEELVSHACDTAERLMAEFTKRGWMLQLPSLVDAMAKAKEAECQKEEQRRSARAQ